MSSARMRSAAALAALKRVLGDSPAGRAVAQPAMLMVANDAKPYTRRHALNVRSLESFIWFPAFGGGRAQFQLRWASGKRFGQKVPEPLLVRTRKRGLWDKNRVHRHRMV